MRLCSSSPLSPSLFVDTDACVCLLPLPPPWRAACERQGETGGHGPWQVERVGQRWDAQDVDAAPCQLQLTGATVSLSWRIFPAQGGATEAFADTSTSLRLCHFLTKNLCCFFVGMLLEKVLSLVEDLRAGFSHWLLVAG